MPVGGIGRLSQPDIDALNSPRRICDAPLASTACQKEAGRIAGSLRELRARRTATDQNATKKANLRPCKLSSKSRLHHNK